MRVTSAPVTSEKRAKSASRQKPKMNGVFQIPDTTRSGKSSKSARAVKSPRPAWSQAQPKKSANPPKKSARVEKRENGEMMNKTRIISKRVSPGRAGSKGSSPNSSPLSARMSVSQSFHIKQPELIESIDHAYQVEHLTEFERRDIAAGQIQRWWRTRRNRAKVSKNLKKILRERKEEYSTKVLEDRETFRQRLLKNKSPKSARVPKQTRFNILEPEKISKTSRPYNPEIDENNTPMKFSKRIQSSRKPKMIQNEKENKLPKPVESADSPAPSAGQASLPDKSVDEQLTSLMSALNELEKPSNPESARIPVYQSQTDLKLARLEANLREMESHSNGHSNGENVRNIKAVPSDATYSVINAKANENQKMMSLIFNESEFEKEQSEKQINILHSALKQQRDQNNKNLEEQEKMFNEERKRITENNSQQHDRQLNFIDQLIKDKQGLADQVTSLVKKIENDDLSRKKEFHEITDKHKVEINAIKDKLTAAEKIRRDKWVEAKQKEIKALTVKGLEPEIARLIARHKQELRNVKAQHEAEIMAADERAARRWADQAERMRQLHEQEKIDVADRERNRAKERVERQLEEMEKETNLIRERLNQEKIVEKERQHQHVEYLKDAQKTQISNLEQLHAENIDATNSEWKLKFDDFQKRSKLEADLARENYEQKMLKHRQELEKNFDQKSCALEETLREKVRLERDAEIERAVNRIEKEMEIVRANSDQTANNKIVRVQEKMQKEIDSAEKAEAESIKKYTETKHRLNERTEELMAEKHKLNLTAAELNQKEDRLDKLLSERHRVSDVIREEFADRLVLLEKEISRVKNESAEQEARFKNQLSEKERMRIEEIGSLNERVQNALKSRDEENKRLTTLAEQSQRRADYMEEMLDKQNKLLRQKNKK